jgi:heterodisulfide reductase subunit C
MARVNAKFIEEVGDRFNATACISCGTCTAVCPMETGMLPRALFRLTMLGQDAKVLEHEDAIFSCLLCKMCEIECPAEVPIAENVRLLRGYFNAHVFDLAR